MALVLYLTLLTNANNYACDVRVGVRVRVNPNTNPTPVAEPGQMRTPRGPVRDNITPPPARVLGTGLGVLPGCWNVPSVGSCSRLLPDSNLTNFPLDPLT